MPPFCPPVEPSVSFASSVSESPGEFLPEAGEASAGDGVRLVLLVVDVGDGALAASAILKPLERTLR